MPRHHSSYRFEVMWQAPSADEPIVLRSTADSNHATMAFHEELRRLMIQGETGELLVRNHHTGDIPILRQPLDRHSPTPEHNRRK